MKKSELYYYAMDAVLDSGFSNEIKLDIIAVLMDDKRTAEFCEKQDMVAAEVAE
jgi:hypothetical protein